MKKTFSLLLFIFCSLFLCAEKFEYNEIFYNTINDSTAEVHFQTWWVFSGYQHDTIAIPPTVDYNGRTYRVVGIVQSAFIDFTSLITVSIPNTVTTIGISAFANCTNLSKVLIPSSVQTIGSAAFAYCTSLKEVTCLAPIPPTCGGLVLNEYEMFYGVDVANIPLYVPTESIELYKNADHWKDFGQILPIEPTTDYKSQWCDTWNVLYHGWDPEGGDDPYMPYTFIYQLEEDTTINDLTYQRLTGRFSLSTMPSNKEYVAALRFAENKKVFVHYDNTEYLLYDFGAQVGDTLEIFGGIDHYKDFKTLTHVITEIDSLDDGRLQIYSNAIIQESEGYETPFERLYPKIWIEGVGSKDGVVQNSATIRIGIGPCVLLCAYHNDECIYTTDNPYYTPYGCVHNDSFFTATEEVNAPTQSVQKIMYNGQLYILRDGKTYNVMGVEITK